MVKGVKTWINGDKYEGDFEDGKISGNGVFHPINGDKYHGEWKNNKRNGNGLSIKSTGE